MMFNQHMKTASINPTVLVKNLRDLLSPSTLSDHKNAMKYLKSINIRFGALDAHLSNGGDIPEQWKQSR
jgi:hypothetical protein